MKKSRGGSKFGRKNTGRSGRRSSDRSDRFGRSDRRDSGRPRNPRQSAMHKVICDKCGKRCEVPFKPTESKPVYCSDCFGKKGHSGSSDRLDHAKEFERINRKLDKIFKALDIKE